MKSAVYTAGNCCSLGYDGFLPPSGTETKILGVLSFSVVSATVPNSSRLESQTRLTQMVALLGRCQNFNLIYKFFCLLKGGLLLSLHSAIMDRSTVPDGK